MAKRTYGIRRGPAAIGLLSLVAAVAQSSVSTGQPATAPPSAPAAPGAAASPQPMAAPALAPEAGQQPAYPTATPACPVCPPGYVCYAGGCAPAYPVCAPGYWFDGRYCVPQAAGPLPTWPDPSEEVALQARLQRRLRPHFTLDLQGGLGLLAVNEWSDDVTVPTPSAAVLLGYRQSFRPNVGLLIRGGVMLGMVILDYSPTSDTDDNGSDSTLMTAGLVEAAPFFGPFGRFYIGPSLWGGYVSFGEQTLRAQSKSYPYTSAIFSPNDGAMYGIGVTGGILVGEMEQVDITFAARLDLNPDHKSTLFLMTGVGFHK